MLLCVVISLQLGLLYAQRDPSFVRPVSRGVQRCLVRWWVDWPIKMISSMKWSITPTPPQGPQANIDALVSLGKTFVLCWHWCLWLAEGWSWRLSYNYPTGVYVLVSDISWNCCIFLVWNDLELSGITYGENVAHFWKCISFLISKTELRLITPGTQPEEPPYLIWIWETETQNRGTWAQIGPTEWTWHVLFYNCIYSEQFNCTEHWQPLVQHNNPKPNRIEISLTWGILSRFKGDSCSHVGYTKWGSVHL